MAKQKLQIFKYQRAISDSHGRDLVLCYNRTRSIMGEYPITEELADLFEQAGKHADFKQWDGMKFYVYGVYEEPSKQVIVAGFAPIQDW